MNEITSVVIGIVMGLFSLSILLLIVFVLGISFANHTGVSAREFLKKVFTE